MTKSREIKLGAFLMSPGHHVAAWRHPSAHAELGADFRAYARIAQEAEAAAADIADQLEERFTEGGADGFNVMPPTLPGGLTDFIALVLPELRRRGLFRSEYGSWIRDVTRQSRSAPAPAARWAAHSGAAAE